MSKSAGPKSGRPDLVELEAQGRIQHSQTRGYNGMPNPTVTLPNGDVVNRGHVRNPAAPAWRAGLSAEKYHALTLKYEDQMKRGRSTDDFRPELTNDEQDDYEKYVKTLNKKNA